MKEVVAIVAEWGGAAGGVEGIAATVYLPGQTFVDAVNGLLPRLDHELVLISSGEVTLDAPSVGELVDALGDGLIVRAQGVAVVLARRANLLRAGGLWGQLRAFEWDEELCRRCAPVPVVEIALVPCRDTGARDDAVGDAYYTWIADKNELDRLGYVV